MAPIYVKKIRESCAERKKSAEKFSMKSTSHPSLVPPAPAYLITHETEETPARNVSPYSVKSLALPVAAPPPFSS